MDAPTEETRVPCGICKRLMNGKAARPAEIVNGVTIYYHALCYDRRARGVTAVPKFVTRVVSRPASVAVAKTIAPAKPTPRAVRARAELEPAERIAFDALSLDYRASAAHRHGSAFYSPFVIADLVRAGWRRPLETP